MISFVKKKYVYNLKESNKADSELFGKKAFILSELSKLGINVPESIIISTLAFDDFLIKNDLHKKISDILFNVRPFIKDSTLEASEKIKNLILESSFQQDLIKQLEDELKRVSLFKIPYFDGQLSTVAELENYFVKTQKQTKLNSLEEITSAIKLLWVSLFSADSIEKRLMQDYKGTISTAVILSKNNYAEYSGEAYSYIPITNEKNLYQISAIFGEYSVQTLNLNSDIYKVTKSTNEIKERVIIPQEFMNISTVKDDTESKVEISEGWKKNQKLSDNQIKEISKIIKKIETKFVSESRFDWIISRDKIYLTNIEFFDIPIPQTESELESSQVNKNIKKKFRTKEIKQEVDLNKIQKEIEEIVVTKSEIKNQKETKRIKKEKKEVQITKDDINRGKAIANLKNNFLLNVHRIDSNFFELANSYNTLFIDFTNLLIENKILPDLIVTDSNLSKKAITNLSLDLATLAKASNDKKTIVQFSNITQDLVNTYFDSQTNINFEGDERFLENPDLLIFEILILKLIRNQHEHKNFDICIPYIRNINNYELIKKIISNQSIKRSNNINFYTEVTIPMLAFEIDSEFLDSIDGLILNVDNLIKLMTYRDTITDADFNSFYKLADKLIKMCNGDKKEILFRMDEYNSQIVEYGIKNKIDGFIIDSILNSKQVKEIEELENKYPRKKTSKNIF